MKRFATVLILAAIFSLIAFYFIYPEAIEKIWLWLVGLIGVIIASLQKAGDWLQKKILPLPGRKPSQPAPDRNTFMQIFRYSRSGNRISGLVYIEGTFAGIASEPSLNTTGTYQMNIQNQQIVLLQAGSFLCNMTYPTPEGNTNDIFLCTDKNNASTNNAEMLYNSVVERLANWLEQEKTAELIIYDITTSDAITKTKT